MGDRIGSMEWRTRITMLVATLFIAGVMVLAKPKTEPVYAAGGNSEARAVEADEVGAEGYKRIRMDSPVMKMVFFLDRSVAPLKIEWLRLLVDTFTLLVWAWVFGRFAALALVNEDGRFVFAGSEVGRSGIEGKMREQTEDEEGIEEHR